MTLRSVSADEVYDGLNFHSEIGALPRWRFRAARIVYLAQPAVFGRLANA
jgi:hypothetical protein